MTSLEGEVGRGGDLDLAGLSRAVKRRRLAIVLPTLLAFAAAVFGVNWVTPRYTADTRILLESRDGYFTRPGSSANDRADALDEQHVQSQILLVTSRDLVRGVVEKLGLQGTEFDPNAQDPGSFSRVLSLLFGAATPANITEDMVDRFLDRVTVYAGARSRVITIEVSSRDPELAARAANALAEAYVEALGGAKQDTARVAGSWLQTVIEPLRQKLSDTEAKVEEYRARAGLLVGSNNATIQQLQLAEISGQLSTARTAEADAKAKAALLKEALRAGRPLEISEVANNELVRRLLTERATVAGQIAFESRTLLPGHPRMKELSAQLAEIDLQIRQAAEKTVRALENDSKVAASRVQALSAAMADRKHDSAQANEDDVQLRALEREAKSQREQLEAYMTRYREALAREGKDGIPPDARIISKAIAPVTPTFPKKLPIVLVATLATFLLSLALVVTRQLMTMSPMASLAATTREGAGSDGAPRLEPASAALAPADPAVAQHTQQQDEAAPSGGPIAARLAAAVAARRQAETGAPASPPPDASAATTETDVAPPVDVASPEAAVPASASSQAVSARIIAGLAERVAGTPTQPGQGVLALCLGENASDMALPLARLLGRRLRVVLVDAQSRGEPARPGLAEALLGKASFFEVIQRDASSRLHRIEPGSPDLRTLSAHQPIGDIMDALRLSYDVVIIALPPERVGAEIAGLADIALCAGPAATIKREHLQELGFENTILVGDDRAPAAAVA